MASTRITQNYREILAAQSTITGNAEYLTSTSGRLNVNATFTPSGTQSVTSATSTGSAVPATAFYIGARNSAGNLAGVQLASDGINTTGNQFLGASLIAQLDDTSPSTVTENNFGNIRMTSDRSLLTTMISTTATVTSVGAATSSTTLLAQNNNRKGATITNDSSSVMYVKLGSTASTSSYTVALVGASSAPFAYYEVPYGYRGVIDAIWASATGNARITEVV